MSQGGGKARDGEDLSPGPGRDQLPQASGQPLDSEREKAHPAVWDFYHFAEHRREVPFQMQPWVLDLSPGFCSDKQ